MSIEDELAFLKLSVGKLSEHVVALEKQYAELRNELESRIKALEDEAPTLYGFGTPAPPAGAVNRECVVPTAVPFGSIGKLVEQVERMFDCHDGDWRSHHTEFGGGGRPAGMYAYVTLGLLAQASASDAQEKLRQAFYTGFLKLRQTCESERPVLYWRYGEAERIQEEIEYNQAPGTPPEVRRYKIRTRFVIPEADFSVVAYLMQKEGEPYSNLVTMEKA